MNESLKKNYPIVIAFLLPILLIIIVALVNIIPSFLLSTNYNFIYAMCDQAYRYNPPCNRYIDQKYTVEEGRLVVNEVSIDEDEQHHYTRLFIHNTETNESREISQDEVEQLRLSSLITSPDGVSVSGDYDRGPDFILFYSGSSYDYYLTKGGTQRKLNLVDEGLYRYSYRDNFQFIGWSLPGRN